MSDVVNLNLDRSIGLAAGVTVTRRVVARYVSTERLQMDLLMILGTIVFFLVAIAYTIACDKLK